MDSVRLSEIILNDNNVKPLIVNFQNGTLQKGNEDKLTCAVLTGPQNNYVAAVASNEMVYTGKISRDDDLYNNFILVRNRKTGDCKLIAVDNVLLNAETTKKRKAPTTPEITSSKLAKATELKKQFGSKRTMRQMEQYEKLQVNVEHVQQNLEQTAMDTTINTADIDEHYADDCNPNRPPMNRQATAVVDVYPLRKIAPVDLLSTLTEKVKTILKEDIENMDASSFMKKRVAILQKSTSVEKELKCQVLLYIDCLITMYATPARAIGAKKFTACTFSEKLNNYILDHFTVKTGNLRTRPISMRDKCLCYILVLCMYVCNFELYFDELLKDLKLSFKKFIEYSKVLSFTTFKDKHVVCLKLPLPSILPWKGQQKRRK